VPGVSATARQPVSVGRQVGPGDGEAVLPCGGDGAPTNMVFIPPGTFRMGSPTNEVDRLTGKVRRRT
jgi:formylglycine-generating enzyme required for sulfatase activity